VDFPDAYTWAFNEAHKRRSDQSWAGSPGEDTMQPHQRAILGLIHLAVFADNNADPREVAWINDEAQNHPVFDGISSRGFRSACMAVMQDMRETPMLELFTTWARTARSTHPREALELAVGAMLADGVVVRVEEGLTMKLISLLGIPIEEASRILNSAYERRGMA
jgi:hypothetical protein